MSEATFITIIAILVSIVGISMAVISANEKKQKRAEEKQIEESKKAELIAMIDDALKDERR